MSDRCRDCDKPLASSLDGLARTTGRSPTPDQNALCWRAWHGDVCQWQPVDWRARCLELHAALALVCDASGSDADHWSRVNNARGVLK